MEGVEFQLRTNHFPVSDRTYPLSHDRRIAQGDQFRRSEELLASRLKSIEETYSSPRAPPHTGEPNCERCVTQKQQLRHAYYDYYLGNEPGRWDSDLLNYREELRRMFNAPDQVTLEDIHARFQQELREHLRKDITAIREGIDSPDEIERKNQVSYLVYGHTLPSALKRVSGMLGQSNDFTAALQETTNAKERAEIYIRHYCGPTDNPQLKNIRAKYARLFESGMSHDTVLGMWKREVLEAQKAEIRNDYHKLGEYKMAQRAHLKKRAEKAEKDQKMQDRDQAFMQRQFGRCSLERCGIEVNLGQEGGVIECAVCDWLARKDRSERTRHVYYCSEEHAEEDFDGHDRESHACIAGSYCINESEPVPEETGAGGICPDCVEHGRIIYFCSENCYQANIKYHRETFHYENRIPNSFEHLELFRDH